MNDLMLGQLVIGLVFFTTWAFIRYLQTRNVVNLTIEMYRQTYGSILENKRIALQPVYKWVYGVYDNNPLFSYSNYVGMRLLKSVFFPVISVWIIFIQFFPSALPFAIVFVGTATWFFFLVSLANSRYNNYIINFELDLSEIKDQFQADKYIDI